MIRRRVVVVNSSSSQSTTLSGRSRSSRNRISSCSSRHDRLTDSSLDVVASKILLVLVLDARLS